MSGVVAAFIAGYVGLIVLGLFGALAWKFRYFYLKNRLRAEFITDRGPITKIVKTDKSTDKFETEIGGYKAMFSIDSNRQLPSGIERMPKSWYFVGDVKMPPSWVDESGNVIVPKEQDRFIGSFPLFEPLDIRTVTVTYPTSGSEYRNAAKNKMVADLIEGFRKPRIDSQSALFIMLGAMILGFGAIGIFSNMRFEDVIELLKPASQVIPR